MIVQPQKTNYTMSQPQKKTRRTARLTGILLAEKNYHHDRG